MPDNPRRGERSLSQLVRRYPEKANYLLGLGYAEHLLGDDVAAQQHLQRACKLSSDIDPSICEASQLDLDTSE